LLDTLQNAFFLPEHDRPSGVRVNPGSHTHLKEPSESTQVAPSPHTPSWHSLMLTHLSMLTSNLKPFLQANSAQKFPMFNTC